MTEPRLIRKKVCPVCGAFMNKNEDGTIYICPTCGNRLKV